MVDSNVLVNLVLILAASILGGALALWLKQPVIIGYLVAGMALGPFTPGPHVDLNNFKIIADVGVALLLFVIGANLTPSKFKGLGSTILIGGAFQIILTIGLGLLFIPWFGLSLPQSFLLGTILAQSSSAVIAKVLDNRGETQSFHGRIAVGISLVQDISSLPILLILLSFLGDTPVTVSSFLLSIGKVFGLAIITVILGRWLWPRLLSWFGRFGSGELTLLTALALAIGGGLAVQAIGLSFAVGAFLAGLVIAESPYLPEAISRIIPFRDLFAAVFFVSIGTLFDPSVLWQNPLPVLGLLTAVVLGKGGISIIAVRLFRNTQPVSIMSGLLLAQIGEFAFILASIGLEKGALSESLFSVIIAVAVISILLNSLLLDSAPSVQKYLAKGLRFNPLMKTAGPSIDFVLNRHRHNTRKEKE